MAMKIEKGIPMPKKKSFRKYAWLDEMEIGDSVLVNTVKEVDIIRAQIRNQGKRSERRKVEEGGYRIWRVE
tara:strand:- start:489 stop:701 length:213 start_codon:yes stop_codon:yes gene_type:complete